MKPQARIQAAIDIFEKAHLSRVPLDSVVGDYMRHRRYIGSKDRAYVADLVYSVARAHARLTWWLDNQNFTDAPRARVLAYLVLEQGADEKRLKGLFDGSKYAPEPLNDDEQAFAKKLSDQTLEHKSMSPSVRAECPPLYEEKLQAYFGDDFEIEMAAMIPGATLDMRVNTFLCTQEKAKNYLEADGVKTDPTPYSPIGLRAQGKAYLCLLYTSPSPRDQRGSRMPSSA